MNINPFKTYLSGKIVDNKTKCKDLEKLYLKKATQESTANLRFNFAKTDTYKKAMLFLDAKPDNLDLALYGRYLWAMGEFYKDLGNAWEKIYKEQKR